MLQQINVNLFKCKVPMYIFVQSIAIRERGISNS